MNYRHLGKAGIQVSELSLGSWVTFHTQTGVADAVGMMGVRRKSKRTKHAQSQVPH